MFVNGFWLFAWLLLMLVRAVWVRRGRL